MDKSPGLDGWPLECFLDLFEVVGNDLLGVVEYVHHSGCVSEYFNSTFIDLIPKKDNPSSFFYFRHISFCNGVYKIMEKFSALQPIPFLSLVQNEKLMTKKMTKIRI